MTEWFKGKPELKFTHMRPVLVEALCPKCTTGTLVFNGTSWPMNPQGFHHTCSKCGYTAAISEEQYPKIKHVRVENAESTR